VREAWTIQRGDGPVVAVALHAGHDVRPEVAAELALPEEVRLREEDPWTDRWLPLAPTRVAVHRSRFEVDHNRPREGAVYRRPDDAWGLEVWRRELPEELVARSLALHDRFRAEVGEVLSALAARWGSFVVYDLHSYNHRREGPDGPAAPVAGNPDVNLGTGSLDRSRWGAVADAFLAALAGAALAGRPLTVGENVRFRGGDFAAWVHATWPRAGCVLAVEVKKVFMDEWSGRADAAAVAAVGSLLAGTVPAVLGALAEAA
jgi:N-formylglutamate amidohydrolase